MTLSDEEARLPAEVEQLLHNWELPEKDEAAWAAMAKAIEARIAQVKPGRGEGDEWLFLPPLPLMNGERVLEPQANATGNFDASGPPDSHASGVQHRLVGPPAGSEQTRRRLPSWGDVQEEIDASAIDRTSGVHPSDSRGLNDRGSKDRSLKEIAEEALRDARAARGGALLTETQSVTALPVAHRRPAYSGIQLSRAVASATTPGDSFHPSGVDSANGTTRLRGLGEGSTHFDRETSSADRETSSGTSRVLRPLFWVTGVVAAAAVILIWLGRQGANPEVASTEAPVVEAIEVPVTAQRTATSGSESDKASAMPNDVATPALADNTTENAALAENTVRAEEQPNTSRAASRRVANRSASKPSLESEPTSGEGTAEAKTKDPVLIPAADLNSRPAHPSVGAAQAAVGATLAPARLCVVGRLVPSQATVVFGSDGHVRSVQVHGDAVGTPAEGCIQRAMGAARVRPFSDESFSVRTTVRP